jgi:hypothetical protein
MQTAWKGAAYFGLVFAAGVLLAVALRGRSLAEYIASRDPVSGGVYLSMPLWYARMPAILSRYERIGRRAGNRGG